MGNFHCDGHLHRVDVIYHLDRSFYLLAYTHELES